MTTRASISRRFRSLLLCLLSLGVNLLPTLSSLSLLCVRSFSPPRSSRPFSSPLFLSHLAPSFSLSVLIKSFFSPSRVCLPLESSVRQFTILLHSRLSLVNSHLRLSLVDQRQVFSVLCTLSVSPSSSLSFSSLLAIHVVVVPVLSARHLVSRLCSPFPLPLPSSLSFLRSPAPLSLPPSLAQPQCRPSSLSHPRRLVSTLHLLLLLYLSPSLSQSRRLLTFSSALRLRLAVCVSIPSPFITSSVSFSFLSFFRVSLIFSLSLLSSHPFLPLLLSPASMLSSLIHSPVSEVSSLCLLSRPRSLLAGPLRTLTSFSSGRWCHLLPPISALSLSSSLPLLSHPSPPFLSLSLLSSLPLPSPGGHLPRNPALQYFEQDNATRPLPLLLTARTITHSDCWCCNYSFSFIAGVGVRAVLLS
ncbi:hypothetical protein C7M84_020654 [Penaeus vannamei]|uniref:Uncharacterized protein n=1 Tax=Penaeus vannamei TaxID=6689 RepID=A0A423SBF4_PENVA|nr:hypothetical protein C7M84_020654 [Penaeus vannamei]